MTLDDVKGLHYDCMPGFNVSWYYKKTTTSTTISGKGIFKDTNGREYNRCHTIIT